MVLLHRCPNATIVIGRVEPVRPHSVTPPSVIATDVTFTIAVSACVLSFPSCHPSRVRVDECIGLRCRPTPTAPRCCSCDDDLGLALLQSVDVCFSFDSIQVHPLRMSKQVFGIDKPLFTKISGMHARRQPTVSAPHVFGEIAAALEVLIATDVGTHICASFLTSQRGLGAYIEVRLRVHSPFRLDDTAETALTANGR